MWRKNPLFGAFPALLPPAQTRLPVKVNFEMTSGAFSRTKCLEHFNYENALLSRKRQPPQRGVDSGENRAFRLNANFDLCKKSKLICSRQAASP